MIKIRVLTAIHPGHIFISLMLMLYGPKLGCVGQAWSIWCFGLINAPKSPHLKIMETHAPLLMNSHSLVCSLSLKKGKLVD